MVVSNILNFHHYLGKISHSTNIFQMGWFNHQPVCFFPSLFSTAAGDLPPRKLGFQEKLRQAEGRANSAERAAQALTEGVFLGLGNYGGKKIRDIYEYLMCEKYAVMIYILIFVHLLLFNSIVVIHGAYQLVIDVLCDLEGHVNYQRHQALKSLHLVMGCDECLEMWGNFAVYIYI